VATRIRGFPPGRYNLTIAVAATAAMYYATRAVVVGPAIDGDALRDLFAALDIAWNHAFYAHGPHVSGPGFDLGPAYYYLLALPLHFWRSAQAIPWWVALWQTATIILLFDTASRLFSRRTALVATALFFTSDICLSLYRPLTHSDLNPLLGLLVIRSLARLQDGRSWAIVGAFFWASLALHFHTLNASLLLMILALLLIARPPVALHHLAFACLAALLPFLPTLGERPSLADIARAASGIIPVAAVVVAAWSRPSPRSWGGGGLVAAVTTWLLLVFVLHIGALGGHAAFRLFNIIVPFDLFNWDGAFAGGKRNIYFLLKTSLPLPENLLVWALAAYTIRVHVPEVEAAWRGDCQARRLPSLLLLLWMVSTAPVALWASIVGGHPRYLAHAWVPLSLAAAVGADAVWHRFRDSHLVRIAVTRRAILWTVALVAPLVWIVLAGFHPAARGLFARRPRRIVGAAVRIGLPLILIVRFMQVGFEAFSPTSYAGAMRVLAALRRDAGLDNNALRQRVHGVISDGSAFLDFTGPMLFLIEFPASVAADGDPSRAYVLVPASDAFPVAAPVFHLDASGLRAIAFRPALRTAEARLVPPIAEQPRAALLPHRFFVQLPAAFRGSDPIFAGGSLDHSGSRTLRFEIPRDQPEDDHLHEIEVLGANALDGSASACEVSVRADGTPIPLQSRIGHEAVRWRFVLPYQQGRSRIEVAISDCRPGYLDVYDVYP
jgi:hypothetical protein